jgi:hypothetical protein
VRQRFLQIEAAAQASASFLRVCVSIDPSAPELLSLRWELLGHPSTGVTLGTSETTLLSRWMSSDDWRPVRLRAKAVVRALAAVSAPTPASLQRLQDLTARISELQHLPLLVVLASCQSAGDGEQGVGASTVECQPRLHQRALTRP